MPAHDFTTIKPNVFHSFHNAWNSQIMGALNNGILPIGYYALSEQVSGDTKPDVVTIDMLNAGRPRASDVRNDGGTMVALPPPKTEISLHADGVTYAKLRRTITVREEQGNAIVALIEVLSNSNKASKNELDKFVEKVGAAIGSDIHVLLIDVYPPNRLAPQGIHGKVWAALGQEPDRWPKSRLLTAASYEAGEPINAYVQPFAVGDSVPMMPLFLRRGFYVNIPLEKAYAHALELMPRHFRELLAHGRATKKGA